VILLDRFVARGWCYASTPEAFSALTRLLLEHGRAPPTMAEYERCRVRQMQAAINSRAPNAHGGINNNNNRSGTWLRPQTKRGPP
jgi:hypothetical protein